jgi:spore coat protein A
MTTRRRFLQAGAATAGGLIIPWTRSRAEGHACPPVPALLDSTTVPKFVDPLPIPAILLPKGNSENAASYQVTMTEFQQQLLPAGFPSTTVWGYAGSFPGPTIEARRNKPVAVKWINELPQHHLFPVDTTLHGSEPWQPEVRTVVHLHGAHTKPQFDGYPEDWYTSNQRKNFAVFNYKNDQEPASLWYHDHAVGNTRLNVYAGLAGLYNIRDEVEDALNLPSGAYEVPLLIQDRIFTEAGGLFYHYVSPIETAPCPSVLPVFVGDTILINGKSWPYLEVEPRKYRFRVVNGSNSRPYRLRIYPDTTPDIPLPFHQIGTDGGLLDAPVSVGGLTGPQVTVAPAERADLVVDFSAFSPGDELTLKNIGPPDLPFDPETVGLLLQFRVVDSSGPDTSVLPAALRPVPRLDPADAVKERNITLDRVLDDYGRPKFLLGNARWMDPITEDPRLNTTEIWNFINTTPNGHPMHVHLVTFEVLSRRTFDVQHFNDTGEIIFTGPEMLPPNENGRRDMVRVPPGTVVQIIAHFDIAGEFVYHCHFLDHEDHEMMRPFRVVPAGREQVSLESNIVT